MRWPGQWEWNCVQSCLSPEAPFRGWFPQPWLVSSDKCPQHSAEISRWTRCPCRPPRLLSAHLSPLWFCALYTLATLICSESFQLRAMARLHLGSSVPPPQPGSPSRAVILFISHLSGIMCFNSCCLCFETMCFFGRRSIYFACGFVCVCFAPQVSGQK